MKQPSRPRKQAAMKAAVLAIIKDFNDRIMKSKTVLDLFFIYEEMRLVLLAEKHAWLDKLNEKPDPTKKWMKVDVDEIAKQVLELEEFDTKIVAEIELVYPQAISLFQAQKNMGLRPRDEEEPKINVIEQFSSPDKKLSDDGL